MMNAQERQLVDDLFDRLSKLESAPRDPDAEAAIARGLKAAPNATYALVQTTLLQDEALRQAQARIQEWEDWYASTQQEQQAQQPQQQQGGFLDSMRGALFGQSQGASGSVPRVQPAEQQRPAWNTGQVLDQQRGPQQNYAQPGYTQPGYGQQPQQQPGGGLFGGGAGGGGGSFLGTAAAAAAGMIGGSLLMNSFRGMTGGGSHHSFADGGGLGGGRTPWGGDQSSGPLAREAGLNDIGSGRGDSGGERHGLFERASYDNKDSGSYDDDGDDDDSDFDGGDSDVA